MPRFGYPIAGRLDGDLKRGAGQKAKWGIEQGLIKQASGVQPIIRDGFDGFYIEMDNSHGTHDFVGGLAHSSRKTEVVSIMLINAPGDETSLHEFNNLISGIKLSDTRNK